MLHTLCPAPPLGPKKGTYSFSRVKKQPPFPRIWATKSTPFSDKSRIFMRKIYPLFSCFYNWYCSDSIYMHYSVEIANFCREKVPVFTKTWITLLPQKLPLFSWKVEHEYVPFLGPRGGAGTLCNHTCIVTYSNKVFHQLLTPCLLHSVLSHI